MDRLRHVIEQKQELLARESISRLAVVYSEGMTTKEQKHYINYLVERVNASDLENRAMKLVLQDFLDKQNDYNEGMREMKADLDALKKELLEKNRRLKSADRKIADLTAKLKFAEADIQKSE